MELEKAQPIILLLDNDRFARDADAEPLKEAGYKILCCDNIDDAWSILGAEDVDLIIAEVKTSGLEFTST